MSKGSTAVRPRAPLARYSNYFEVGHNAYEFLVDFGQYHPEVGSIALHTRIAVGPTHAKLLSSTLTKAVTAYEAEHGVIADMADPPASLDVVLRSSPDFQRRLAAARRHSQKR